MKRSLSLCLALCLAVACGETPDPSSNNTTNNNPTPDMNNTTADMNTPTDMNTTPTDMNTDMVVTPTDMGTDMMITPKECVADSQFIMSKSEVGQAGLTLSPNKDAYTDSGLQGLWTKFKEIQDAGMFPADDPNVMGTNECNTEVALDTPIKITGALVTGVGFTAGTFIEDKNKGMNLFVPKESYPVDAANKPIYPKAGDKISFNVVGIKRYGCSTPEITKITDYTLDSEKNALYAETITTQEITLADHYNKMVMVSGQLTNPRECGKGTVNGMEVVYRCFDLNYGPEGAKKVVTARTYSNYACASSAGNCGTFLGPITSFPGIYGKDPMIQLNATNYRWLDTGYSAMECPNGL